MNCPAAVLPRFFRAPIVEDVLLLSRVLRPLELLLHLFGRFLDRPEEEIQSVQPPDVVQFFGGLCDGFRVEEMSVVLDRGRGVGAGGRGGQRDQDGEPVETQRRHNVGSWRSGGLGNLLIIYFVAERRDIVLEEGSCACAFLVSAGRVWYAPPMRTTLFLLAASLLFAAVAAAPGEPPPPAKDAPLDASYLRLHAETRGFMLGRPVKPKPTPDGKFVLFLRSQPKSPKQSLFEFDVSTGKTRELLTPEQLLKGAEEHLSPEEKARRERQRVSVGGFTDFQLSPDGSQILVALSGKLYRVERKTGKPEPFFAGDGPVVDPKFSPVGSSIACVRGQDVYSTGAAAGELAVTTGGTEKKTHGLAEFVAQEEMGRFTGYWWSPDAKSIAFEEADAEGVEVWQVADPIHPDQPAQPFFYPRPGKANVKVRLGIVDASPVRTFKPTGGQTLWVEWDDKTYPYLADVRWDKNGPMTLTVQNRKQTEQLLLKVDPATGKTTPLLTERDAAWVNIRHDGPRWLKDGSFLWVGEGKAGPQLERRDKDGALQSVLVSAGSRLSGIDRPRSRRRANRLSG